jgi:hypothetical protein
VKLNVDHSRVCKFRPSLKDQDNLKLVRGNIKDLYKNALKTSELSAMPSTISTKGSVKAIDNREL